MDPYTLTDSHSWEQERIFREYWIFVGLTSSLKNQNDYFLKTVAGRDIVLQNLRGEIVAFDNACPHRQKKFFDSPFGNSPLRCQFHGWSFDKDRPVRIPLFDESYDYSVEELSKLKLKNYSIEILGQLIFVNLAENPLKIEEQFSLEILDILKSISGSFDENFVQTTAECNYNWKLGYEIIFDVLHVQFLHAKTLAQSRESMVRAGMNATPSPGRGAGINDLPPAHIKELSLIIKNPIADYKEESWFSSVERYGSEDIYYDILAFPNLHIVSATGGHSFLIELYNPSAVDKTAVDICFLTAKRTKSLRYWPVVMLENMRAGVRVFQEDIVASEQVQMNVLQSSRQAVHGLYERDLVRWRNWHRHMQSTIV